MTTPQQMLIRLREANTPHALPLITDAIAVIEALVRERDAYKEINKPPRLDVADCDWHESNTERTDKIKDKFFDTVIPHKTDEAIDHLQDNLTSTNAAAIFAHYIASRHDL